MWLRVLGAACPLELLLVRVWTVWGWMSCRGVEVLLSGLVVEKFVCKGCKS